MKKVLITGASGGIGSACVYKFIEEGYFVIGVYNSDNASIKGIIDRLKNQNKADYFCAFKCDFTCQEQIKDTICQIQNSFKSVDVLVNNAGVSLFKQITDTTIDDWNKLFDVNTKSTYLFTNALLPSMTSKKYGKIINVSSIWGVVGASCEVGYSASKSAIIGYTKALAKEVGYSGVNVNCVCPGVIETKMNSRLTDSEIEDIKNSTPMGRLGKPSEVAELIYFLASEKADFVTGQVITIDGGFIL